MTPEHKLSPAALEALEAVARPPMDVVIQECVHRLRASGYGDALACHRAVADAIADLERGGYDLVRADLLPIGNPILRASDAVDPVVSALLATAEFLDFAAVHTDAVPPGLGILRKRRFRASG